MIDKTPAIPYSYFIAIVSEKGHIFGGKCDHKSGSVSLPKFFKRFTEARNNTPSFAGGNQIKSSRVMCE